MKKELTAGGFQEIELIEHSRCWDAIIQILCQNEMFNLKDIKNNNYKTIIPIFALNIEIINLTQKLKWVAADYPRLRQIY